MIKLKYRSILLFSSIIILLLSGCKDLDDLNINPNGVDPEIANLNLLLPTIQVGVGQTVVNLGFGDLAGVMQHTQLDGWFTSHNSYEWDNLSQSWSGYYGILRNNEEYYNKAIEGEYEFHQGIALIMRAYTFGLITDLWGDAPYTDALKAEEGDQFFKPLFDPQQDIYTAMLGDLEVANTLLSKPNNEYDNIQPSQDLIYGGDVAKWRKFANSLALRYYMRLSAKLPMVAEEGIRKITSNSNNYPIITQASEDADIGYIGTSQADSWPSSMEFNPDPSGTYMRRKMCSTLVESLLNYNDPRLEVWAKKIETPLVLVSGSGVDRIVDGKREVSQDIVNSYESAFDLEVDFNEEYVGIPPAIFSPQAYNLTPDMGQGTYNPHTSHLNDIYKLSSHELLQMRLMSAAEVHLILSEASLYGWSGGTPEEHYSEGINQSFKAWGVNVDIEEYIEGAPYTGLESIIEQKWIASWTASAESWFDWRRTGHPDLQPGDAVKRNALPLRFYYHLDDEISKNTENAEAAINRLETTSFKGSDVSNNSAWSKIWVLQGVGTPY